jgi:hypothetical protein
MKKTESKAAVTKKQYSKPEVRKHKSVAVVSGSGCSYYNSKTSGNTYYH